MMEEEKYLKRGMKVKDTRQGHIGTIVKLGGRSSKVRIPIFGRGDKVIRQIPNKYLVRRNNNA